MAIVSKEMGDRLPVIGAIDRLGDEGSDRQLSNVWRQLGAGGNCIGDDEFGEAESAIRSSAGPEKTGCVMQAKTTWFAPAFFNSVAA